MKTVSYRDGMVVGNANTELWSQVAVRPLESKYLAILTKIETQGGGELLSLPEVGTELIEILKRKLPEAGDQETLKKLVHECVGDIKTGLKVSVGAMLFGKNKLMAVTVGDLEIYIAREAKIGRIASGEAAVGGESQAGDFYVLTTKDVPNLVGITKWKELVLAGLSGIEELAVEVHGRGRSEALATVAVELKAEANEGKPFLTITGVKEYIANFWQKPLKIRQEQLKLNAWIGGGLVTLLLVGIVIGVIRRGQIVKESAFVKLEGIVEQRVREAKSIGSLNPERAKYLLTSAKTEVEAYRDKTKDDKYINQANELLTEIGAADLEIFKKEEVTANIFIETKILAEDFAPEMMRLNSKGEALLFESNLPEIWGVSLSDKSSYKIAAGEVKSIKDLISNSGKIYVLNDEGVYVVDPKTKSAKKEIEKDDLWSNPKYIDQYAGNIYVLDKGQGEIWKYPVLTNGFGARRRWLGPGIELDLSNVSQWGVDGDIWLITTTGKLERYRRGVPVVFPMEAFPYVEQGRLSNPSSIFLSDKKVYVAENGAKRIVVFDKESGKYESQYVNEEFVKARAVAVWDNKCYVLLDGKIVWFNL